MTDGLTPQQKAAKTARWSVTMTRWLITRLKSKISWNLMSFLGKGGGESTGVVDIMAIRKDHRQRTDGLKRGDLFEIILIQVKGGSAAWPTLDDINRLRKVGKKYVAKAIILAGWKKGKQPILHVLTTSNDPRKCWKLLEKPLEIFN